MIIATKDLKQNIDRKIKYFSDKTYILSIINTEGNLGVVCYLKDNIWQPFCYDYGTKKLKYKGKTFDDLINSLPQIECQNIADIKGKFYNTFDTPVEVNNKVFATTFELLNQGKNTIIERKNYYLITDIQELERTFNSNIMPCEIIDLKSINQSFNGKWVDDSLKYVVTTYLMDKW